MDSTISAQGQTDITNKDKGIWKQLIQTLVRPPKNTYSKTVLGKHNYI